MTNCFRCLDDEFEQIDKTPLMAPPPPNAMPVRDYGAIARPTIKELADMMDTNMQTAYTQPMVLFKYAVGPEGAEYYTSPSGRVRQPIISPFKEPAVKRMPSLKSITELEDTGDSSESSTSSEDSDNALPPPPLRSEPLSDLYARRARKQGRHERIASLFVPPIWLSCPRPPMTLSRWVEPRTPRTEIRCVDAFIRARKAMEDFYRIETVQREMHKILMVELVLKSGRPPDQNS